MTSPTRDPTREREPTPDDVKDSAVLADRSRAQLSSESPHSAAEADRCRDPQPSIMWSLGILPKREEGVMEPEGSRSPQENL